MKPVLVVQLARFGDLIQTKRLMLRLGASGREVHLLADASLGRLARRLYPQAVVHELHVHTPPDANTVLHTLAGLAATDFHRVYNLNLAGASQAVSALFDPASIRGYRLEAGQQTRDPWAAMAMRWTKNRRQHAVNLADFWAGFQLPLYPARRVNPRPEPRGAGLGVAMAGRHARRSLPPKVLAGLVQALVAQAGGGRIVLLGTAAERAAARELMRLLPPRVAALCQDLTGRTDWDSLYDTVAGLGLMLTPDTGLMHLAAHLGVPVAATFLSSAWCHETGPYGEGHTVWQGLLPCSPCLESAACPNGHACLPPFMSREFLRLVSGKPVDPPPGLVGYVTGIDELGAVCTPFTGRDGLEPERLRMRAFVSRHLGAAGERPWKPSPDIAERMVEEPDFMLQKHQPSLEIS